MVKFNLFLLQDEKDKRPLSWICASGKELSKEVENLLNDLYQRFKKKDLDKILVTRLKVSYITASRLRRRNRKWYPLIFLQTLSEIWKNVFNKSDSDVKKLNERLQSKIELLKCNNGFSKPVRAVKNLTIELCKICGAHAADGTLYNNLIRITDEDKHAVEAFKNWVETTFEVKLPNVIPVRKGSDKEWGLFFQIKIIARYLKNFFDFPSGKKTYSVEEPNIIKKSDLKFRKAFALGVLTFEAGLGAKPQIGFGVRSKNLRDSLCEILKLLDMNIKVLERESWGNWKFWSKELSCEEARKWIELFEPQTEKWFKLFEIINGFQGKVDSVIDVFYIFNKIYPDKPATKVSLNDIFQIILEQKEITRYQLVELIKQKNNLESFGGKWAHGASLYLNILKKANIIFVEKKNFGKKKSFGSIIREIYKLNSEISSWKVPFRPWLRTEVNYVEVR
jgi:hypothetical protein